MISVDVFTEFWMCNCQVFFQYNPCCCAYFLVIKRPRRKMLVGL